MPLLKELRGDLPLQLTVPVTPANVPGGGSIIAPFAALITAAKWVPGAAVTANVTNFFTLSFRNRGSGGAGTVQFATARAYSSVNGVLSTPETLTLSSTASDLQVAAGDVLAVEVVHTGTGLVCPGGVVMLTTRSAG
jgi:hypothetical protein